MDLGVILGLKYECDGELTVALLKVGGDSQIWHHHINWDDNSVDVHEFSTDVENRQNVSSHLPRYIPGLSDFKKKSISSFLL